MRVGLMREHEDPIGHIAMKSPSGIRARLWSSARGYGRDAGRPIASLAVFAAMGCLVFSVPATAQASSAPVVGGEVVLKITPTDATLEAQVNPGGLETTYEVWVGAYPACIEEGGPERCESTGEGEIGTGALVGTIRGGSSAQDISIDIGKDWHRLSPNSTYIFNFRAVNAAGKVYGKTTQFTTAAPPSIDGESVPHLTATDATLEAQVNLHEASAGADYQFQLVKAPSEYASEILCPSKLPPGTNGCIGSHSASALPIGFIPGNTLQPGVDLPARLDLASAGVTLRPGTTYHYRILVARSVLSEDTIEWEPPTVYGPDQTFTTPWAGTPPVIGSVSVSHLTTTDATLEAQVNTEGLSTIYEFEMWSSPCSKHGSGCEFVQNIALPSGLLLGSFVDQNVSLDLNSAGVTLAAGEYGYAMRATNADGSTQTLYQIFEPPETAVQPPRTTTSPPLQLTTSGTTVTGTGNVVCPDNVASTGCGIKALPKPPKPLTRVQRLTKALKVCERKPKNKRGACQKQARKRYGAKAAKTNKS